MLAVPCAVCQCARPCGARVWWWRPARISAARSCATARWRPRTASACSRRTRASCELRCARRCCTCSPEAPATKQSCCCRRSSIMFSAERASWLKERKRMRVQTAGVGRCFFWRLLACLLVIRGWDPLLPLPMSQAAPDSAHGAHAGALGGSSSTHEVGWLPLLPRLSNVTACTSYSYSGAEICA